MKLPSKVSNQELIESIKQSLKYNIESLDFVENKIKNLEDTYKYNESSVVLSEINIHKYIKFNLEFLDKQYRETLKRLGVNYVEMGS